ncbi:MAG: response regulator transcription factor [Caldilineaceae bacterium]|nr:response regulator transcription factor [Caldilineaceae bacterium]
MHRSSEISLLIVADDLLARAGLAALLAGQPGLYVAGQSDCGPALDALDQQHAPDALLWDLGWDFGEAENNPLLERLADFTARLPVLALLPDGEEAGKVWAAGVAGLLPRQVDGERLSAALAAVTAGLLVLDPGQRDLLAPASDIPPAELLEPLTPREEDVLALLADGLTNRAIARQLAISENTVKFHVQSLLGKLDAQSRTDAVVRATRLGLLIL